MTANALHQAAPHEHHVAPDILAAARPPVLPGKVPDAQDASPGSSLAPPSLSVGRRAVPLVRAYRLPPPTPPRPPQDDASAPRFIAEFVQMGGIGTLLDILQSPGGSPGHDEDKRRALAVLITLARSGRAHKELMTAPPYSAGDAALALVLRTHDPRAHEHIVELLTELGRDNPRFAPHLLNRTLAVLGSRSAHCACTAAKAVRDLLPEAHPTQRRPGEAEGAGPAPPPPMGALVGAAMGLLHHRDEEVRGVCFRGGRACGSSPTHGARLPHSPPQLLQVTIDLLKVVSQYEGGGATVVSALLPYLSGAHSGASPPRKPGAGAHGGGRDEPRPQATDLLQANATRILAAVAPAACKTDLLVASLLLGEDVIYDLMVPLANFGHRPSQVAAVECVNALMQANGGERVAINLTMATSEEMMAWLLHAKDAPAEALDNCPADIREQLEHGAAAGRAKRGHADQGGRPQGLSIEEALGSALAVRGGCLRTQAAAAGRRAASRSAPRRDADALSAPPAALSRRRATAPAASRCCRGWRAAGRGTSTARRRRLSATRKARGRRTLRAGSRCAHPPSRLVSSLFQIALPAAPLPAPHALRT